MKKIGLAEIKTALKDDRFRKELPESLSSDVIKFLNNPGCGCNLPLYKKIIKDHKDIVKKYYGDKIEIIEEEKEIENISKNNWAVINCNVYELENELKKLKPGRKQIAISRYEDEVTCIVNELDYVY